MQRMHVMESGGRLVSGAAAFVAMWRRLPRYRPLEWVVSLPGIFGLAVLQPVAAADSRAPVALTGATIFDGTGVPLTKGIILVRGKRIAATSWLTW